MYRGMFVVKRMLKWVYFKLSTQELQELQSMHVRGDAFNIACLAECDFYQGRGTVTRMQMKPPGVIQHSQRDHDHSIELVKRRCCLILTCMAYYKKW